MLKRAPWIPLLGVLIGLTLVVPCGWAAPFSLTNGPGDGTVSIGVDGFGAFGSSVGVDSSNAVFDPLGPRPPLGTTFQSGVAIGFGSGGRTFLTSGSIGGTGSLSNPVVSGSPTSGSSAFTLSGLSFSLTQTLIPIFSGSTMVGTELMQDYRITNTTAGALGFDVVRYMDPDISTLTANGGGKLGANLFATETATGTSTSPVFVGISADGGTVPSTNRFEVSAFDALRSTIVSGGALADVVVGDFDLDGIIDPVTGGYDVTLALRTTFSLGPGATGDYQTNTFFESAPPEVTGSAPAPPSWLILAIGVGVLGAFSRRRRAPLS